MLIIDRTQNDVARAQELIYTGYKNLTPEQKKEWDSGLKGCYSVFDLNRVENEVKRISDILNEAGYENKVEVNAGWQTNDILTEADVERYLNNIEILRAAFFVYSTTPETPVNYKPYNYANDIEKILFDISNLFTSNQNEVNYMGEIYAGDLIGVL